MHVLHPRLKLDFTFYHTFESLCREVVKVCVVDCAAGLCILGMSAVVLVPAGYVLVCDQGYEVVHYNVY